MISGTYICAIIFYISTLIVPADANKIIINCSFGTVICTKLDAGWKGENRSEDDVQFVINSNIVTDIKSGVNYDISNELILPEKTSMLSISKLQTKWGTPIHIKRLNQIITLSQETGVLSNMKPQIAWESDKLNFIVKSDSSDGTRQKNDREKDEKHGVTLEFQLGYKYKNSTAIKDCMSALSKRLQGHAGIAYGIYPGKNNNGRFLLQLSKPINRRELDISPKLDIIDEYNIEGNIGFPFIKGGAIVQFKNHCALKEDQIKLKLSLSNKSHIQQIWGGEGYSVWLSSSDYSGIGDDYKKLLKHIEKTLGKNKYSISFLCQRYN